MSQVHRRGPTKPQMNITPLIDVVFLLIIFFMLVNRIVAEETVEMIVPEVANPKTYELGEVEKIVVNVAPSPDRRGDNPLEFDGEPRYVKVGQLRFGLDDLAGITDALNRAKARNPELEVNLRADAALYFETVQPIMSAITDAKIGRINLVAYLPDQGPMAGSGGSGGTE